MSQLIFKETLNKPGMEVCVLNPSTWDTEAGAGGRGHQFNIWSSRPAEAKRRPSQKKKRNFRY